MVLALGVLAIVAFLVVVGIRTDDYGRNARKIFAILRGRPR